MRGKTILAWLRNDLRIHDNEVLLRAAEQGGNVIPVYCFDPRLFGEGLFGTRKTGVLRAAFLLETVDALKDALQAMGGDLFIAVGKPEDILPELTQKYQVDEVYHHREVAFEETQVSAWVEEALWKHLINLKHFIGHTLYHKEDLPIPIKDIPEAFAAFRKMAERESSIRPTLPSPERISVPADLESTSVPTLSQMGYSEEEIALAAELPVQGGEDAALQAMKAFLSKPQEPPAYSLLSPHVAAGALSPNLLFHEVKAAEGRLGKKQTEANILKLLWRDYYRFMFKKHGNRFFQPQGFADELPYAAQGDDASFEQWKEARTGVSLIDRGMRQLNTTGWVPDEMRVLLAAYLTQELRVPWLRGAAWFEEKLIDYNPSTNYGNWAHIAGVGSSARENKPVDWQRLMRRLEPSLALMAD